LACHAYSVFKVLTNRDKRKRARRRPGPLGACLLGFKA
jgi:hypothetical protein